MFTTTETTTIVFIVAIALGVLGWGFNRARAYGKLGILAWLQSVALIVPWLLWFDWGWGLSKLSRNFSFTSRIHRFLYLVR
jgi:hypothetical protein